MKTYPVNESEFDSMSLLNNLASGFFAGASALFLFAAGMIIDLAIAGQLVTAQLTDSGRVIAFLVAPLCGIASVVLLLCGVWATRRRNSIWSNIKSEAYSVTPQ
jgi:uncharacterized membrane protein YdcZ (DUF606 family)